MESGNFVSQYGIALRNFVRPFRIADSAFFDLAFQAPQGFECLSVSMDDRFAQGLSDLRVQSWIDFVGAIEVFGSPVEILLVVLSKAAVEQEERRIIDVW